MVVEQGFGPRLDRLLPRRQRTGGRENPFSIHEKVEWDIKGKNPRTERGTIEIIVPPNQNPKRLMTLRWGTSRALSTNKKSVVPYYTYVVEQKRGNKPLFVLVDINRLRAVK